MASRTQIVDVVYVIDVWLVEFVFELGEKFDVDELIDDEQVVVPVWNVSLDAVIVDVFS